MLIAKLRTTARREIGSSALVSRGRIAKVVKEALRSGQPDEPRVKDGVVADNADAEDIRRKRRGKVLLD